MRARSATAALDLALFGLPRAIPDRIEVGALTPDTGRDSELPVHADKAIAQRATILASIADGKSVVHNLPDCRDIRANLRGLQTIGTSVRTVGAGAVEIAGRHPADINPRGVTLDAGNSATTSRLFIAVLAGSGADCLITGNDSLRSRPMSEVVHPLRELGADLVDEGGAGRLPVRVRGTRLGGGSVSVQVDSAQPVSALLFAGVHANAPVTIQRQTPARDHTERLLRWTGVDIRETVTDLEVKPSRPKAFELTVPGDPSAAALLAAMHVASLRHSRDLTMRGMNVNPRRIGFFELLQRMGVSVTQSRHRHAGPEPVADITVSRHYPLTGLDVGGPALVQSCIDELPMIAALATVAGGTTRIRDAHEMRSKDTDRIAATVALLRSFGARASQTQDGLVVEPASRLQSPRLVSLPPDHRIVFAAFVLCLLAGGHTELRGVSAAATSHPGAVRDLCRFAHVRVVQ